MGESITRLDVVSANATREAAAAMAERLEYHLLGAWRAGYDWVHVYEPLPDPEADFRDRMTTRLYLLEGNEGEFRPDPPDLRYIYSYDLGDVPDDRVRDAIRGE